MGHELVNGEEQKRAEGERAKKKLQGRSFRGGEKSFRASVFALLPFCLCGK